MHWREVAARAAISGGPYRGNADPWSAPEAPATPSWGPSGVGRREDRPSFDPETKKPKASDGLGVDCERKTAQSRRNPKATGQEGPVKGGPAGSEGSASSGAFSVDGSAKCTTPARGSQARRFQEPIFTRDARLSTLAPHMSSAAAASGTSRGGWEWKNGGRAPGCLLWRDYSSRGVSQTSASVCGRPLSVLRHLYPGLYQPGGDSLRGTLSALCTSSLPAHRPGRHRQPVL